MASITRHPNGRREVQFVGVDQKRRTIRLGKVDQKTAENSRLRIDELNAAKIHGSPLPIATLHWLCDIGDALHDRLTRAGLCEPRAVVVQVDLALGKVLDRYIDRRDDLKPGTVTIYRQAKQHIARYFGEERQLPTITVAEATDFRRALRKRYSEAYTAKIIIKARTFWRDAVDRQLVEANIFAKVPAGSQVNSANQRYVERDTIERIIAVCPDPQWKLLLALSRYAGLRCPSEHLTLQWADVDWERRRMTVRAVKTEHHADKGVRVVPLFPELLPYLRAVFDGRDPEAMHVITRYRHANANLRTQLLRYVEQAGVQSWPRLFHNLRASCQTDLTERFPSHVVCRWIGNSEAVARDHYLQTTESHFAKAAGPDSGPVSQPAPKSDAKSDAATGGTAPQPDASRLRYLTKVRDLLTDAIACESVREGDWAILDSNQ